MKRDAVINLRVPIEVREAVKAAAEADAGRSMSGMTVKILIEWLSERGYLKGQPGERKKKGR